MIGCRMMFSRYSRRANPEPADRLSSIRGRGAMMNEQTLQIPLLAGFLGLMFGWLIFGFFLNGIVLAIVSVIIAIVAFAGGFLVTTMRKR
jgi:hypothetical protein